MNLQEIVEAVNAGKLVHWSQDGYIVVGGPYATDMLVKCIGNNHCVGLTHSDGVTLSDEERTFYTNNINSGMIKFKTNNTEMCIASVNTGKVFCGFFQGDTIKKLFRVIKTEKCEDYAIMTVKRAEEISIWFMSIVNDTKEE